MSEPRLRDQDYLRYDGFRVISNAQTGQIEAMVPLKPHPPSPGRSPGLRKGWWMLLQLSLDALLRRSRPKP